MLYVIQKDIFKETNYKKIFKTLDRLELEYEIVDSIAELFTDELKVETDRTDVFVFGSVKLARLAAKKNWIPGSFYGGNHDFSIYKEFYKENLLNYDSIIQKITDPINFSEEVLIGSGYGFKDSPKFIRPTKDSKTFTGGLFTRIKWEDKITSIQEYLKKANREGEEILIQVSSIKRIYKEARVWIVDGRVITSSYYLFNGLVQYEEDVEPEGLEFAQSMVNLYQVAEAFVMDICLTPDGWKIVEINCINCAGFYNGDLQKIIIALEDKYNPIV